MKKVIEYIKTLLENPENRPLTHKEIVDRFNQ